MGRLKTTWVLNQLLNVSADNTSIVVSSNKCDAISTAMIALWDRFRFNKSDQIHLLKYLNDDDVRDDMSLIEDYKINEEKLDAIKTIKFYRERLVVEAMENESFC